MPDELASVSNEIPGAPPDVPVMPSPMPVTPPEVTPEAPVTPAPEAPVVPAPEEPPMPVPEAPITPSSPAQAMHVFDGTIGRTKAIARRRKDVDLHLEKVLVYVREKKKIRNRDVTRLLRVSDATASRYLSILVSRGQLQRVGKGRAVVYLI
jgi:hypothetical protein